MIKLERLLKNKMTVEKVYYDDQLNDASAGIHGGNPLMTIMNFANDTQVQDDGKLLGDPTETALVAYGKTQNYDVAKALTGEPRIAEVPFDSERKLMTTIHRRADGKLLVATKGAPDELLKRVTDLATGENTAPLSDSERDAILKANKDMATQALRVLGMAYKVIDTLPEKVDSDTVENHMILLDWSA